MSSVTTVNTIEDMLARIELALQQEYRTLYRLTASLQQLLDFIDDTPSLDWVAELGDISRNMNHCRLVIEVLSEQTRLIKGK